MTRRLFQDIFSYASKPNRGSLRVVLPADVLSRGVVAGLAVGVLASAFLAPASAASVDSKLSVNFAGLNVAQLRNAYRVEGSRYSIDGTVKTNGFVSIFADTKARFRSSGRFSGTNVVPDAHKLTYSQRRKKGELSLDFSKGNIIDAVVLPKPKKKKDRVPILPEHLKAVLDPISALVFPVSTKDVDNGARICNRTVPLYTGASRINLRFSLKGTRAVEAQGFSGTGYVCSVRYIPVSGHRPGRKDVRFMVANRDMNVTMVRLGNSNAYGLFAFRVKTRRGLARGKATVFAAR